MGDPLPIGFADLDRYATRLGWHDPDGFEEFLLHITSLDELWFTLRREAAKGN